MSASIRIVPDLHKELSPRHVDIGWGIGKCREYSPKSRNVHRELLEFELYVVCASVAAVEVRGPPAGYGVDMKHSDSELKNQPNCGPKIVVGSHDRNWPRRL